MSTKVIEPPVLTVPSQPLPPAIDNGVEYDAGVSSSTNGAHEMASTLPTFPLESGWRTVCDPVTGEFHQMPLTLRDILFPTEEDIGVVYMAQSPMHNLLTGLLYTMLHTYLGARAWLILHDVLVLWGVRGVTPKSPDIVAFPGGRFPANEKSYRVGRDGPLPTFIIEVTSEDTRREDLLVKPLYYAALGIREYLIIDILNDASEPWALIGYRLDAGPFYRRLPADPQGGIAFATVGLRFVAVNRTRIEVYDSATGQRLLSSDELIAQAEAERARAAVEAERAAAEAERAAAETERANAEAQARTLAEAQAAAATERAEAETAARLAAEAELQALKSRYGLQ
ncbi:MAG: Uma2 family endonuclease [Caldilinea sp. CFX5]|nr:Uma2 family endonuclease [Caldilinea sp. CFX5]